MATPVAVGIRAAPKNKRHHRRGIMYIMLLRKPIGAEKIKAHTPKRMHNFIAVNTFLPLYPP